MTTTTTTRDWTLPTYTDRLALVREIAGNSRPDEWRLQLVINPEERTAAAWAFLRDGGTSMSIHHGLQRTVRLPNNTDAVALTGYLASHVEVLERIASGHSSEWDGSNHVGRLTDDARQALEYLEADLDSYGGTESAVSGDVGWRDAQDDLCGDDAGITSATTDDQLSAIASDLDYAAASDCGVILINTVDALVCIRDRQRDAGEIAKEIMAATPASVVSRLCDDITQADVAKMLGVSQPTVSAWVNGQQAMSRPVRMLALAHLGVLPAADGGWRAA